MVNISKINFNGETLNIKDTHARDQLTHLTADNYTADVTGDYTVNAGDIAMSSANITMHATGDYTVNAGDIAMSSANITMHATGDRTIDTDGNDSVHIDGASTLNVGGLRTETFAGDKTEAVTGDKTESVTGTSTEIYNNTHTETNNAKKIENAKDKILNVENLEINSARPVTYKKPVINGNLVTVPMMDTDGNEYNILCAGTELDSQSFTPYLFVGHQHDSAALVVGYTADFSTFVPMVRFDDIVARDPQILYLNGIFYVCCTYYSSDYSYDTVIYTTKDFKNWTRHNINLGISNGATWAPELAFYNGTLYIFYSHTDRPDYTNMKMYRSTCTNLDTLEFTNGVLVNGIDANVIDPSIYHNDIYNYTVLITKNEADKCNYLYEYDFATNTCAEKQKIGIPPHTEAVSCYSMGRFVAIIGDRYLAPSETGYGTQNILSAITSDLRDSSLVLKTINCFCNPVKDKVAGLRHVSCLKITSDMVDTLITNVGHLTPIAINRQNPYPEHVNIEDFGTRNDTNVTITDLVPYPNTVYCIFNNPTGVTTHTTTVNLNSILNYFNLYDLYIYIGSDIDKSLTINTREGTTTINLTAADKDRFIHLRQGIDTKWSVVKGY